jgi:hypothetical protein
MTHTSSGPFYKTFDKHNWVAKMSNKKERGSRHLTIDDCPTFLKKISLCECSTKMAQPTFYFIHFKLTTGVKSVWKKEQHVPHQPSS